MIKTPIMMVFDLIKEGKADSLQFLESVLIEHERRVLDDCFDSSRLAHPSTGFQYACFEDWYNDMFTNNSNNGSDADIDKKD
jgi:hypothetical protein